MARAASFHRPDAVLCNSAFIASMLPRTYRSVPHAVVHYPSAPPAPSARDARRDTRRALGAADDDVVIVQASRLDSWKGHEIHLQAAGRLSEMRGWRLWFAGGPQRAAEAEYEQALRALAARLRISDRVTFLGQRDDVSLVLAAGDIYCQPNTQPEPFGLSYVEALAAGLPVVASDFGGASEIVTHDTGILVPPRDVDALAAALKRLVGDKTERRRLGRNGPARAAALCDPLRQLAALEAFLGRVMRRVA
jgi:glycosyltransferase involved in cell wall biosynthesis